MVQHNTPRYLRKHINSSAVRKLAIAAVCCILGFFGCTGEKEKGGISPESTPETERGITAWYIWENGKLEPHSSPEQAVGAGWRIWTDQIRGTSLLYIDGTVYCGVNGLGIALIDKPFREVDLPLIAERYKPSLFSDRTMGTLFFYEDKLYSQLYYNTVFHSEKPPSPPIALTSFNPLSGEYRVIPFSFQDENEEWELISLLPFEEEEYWYLTWKRTDEEKTQYRYTKITLDDWKETEINEEQFLSRLAPETGLNAPVEIQRLLRGYDGNRGESVFDITVSYPEQRRDKIYRFGDLSRIEESEGTLVRLNAFVFQDVFYLLLPNGRIAWMDTSGKKGIITLPALPRSFSYTDFITDGFTVIVFWEEQDFIKVKNAGILLFRPAE